MINNSPNREEIIELISLFSIQIKEVEQIFLMLEDMKKLEPRVKMQVASSIFTLEDFKEKIVKYIDNLYELVYPGSPETVVKDGRLFNLYELKYDLVSDMIIILTKQLECIALVFDQIRLVDSNSDARFEAIQTILLHYRDSELFSFIGTIEILNRKLLEQLNDS